MTNWNQPALTVLLTRLAAVAMRAERVRLAQRARSLANLAALRAPPDAP